MPSPDHDSQKSRTTPSLFCRDIQIHPDGTPVSPKKYHCLFVRPSQPLSLLPASDQVRRSDAGPSTPWTTPAPWQARRQLPQHNPFHSFVVSVPRHPSSPMSRTCLLTSPPRAIFRTCSSSTLPRPPKWMPSVDLTSIRHGLTGTTFVACSKPEVRTEFKRTLVVEAAVPLVEEASLSAYVAVEILRW